MEYRHTQIGTLIIAVFCMILFLILLVPFIAHSIEPALLLIILFLVAMLSLFYSLTVEIHDKTLICSFGIGLIRRRISLTDVAAAQAVRNPWWVGWGIRWYPGRYWLWNVSGFDAVELLFKNGTVFRIGTNEPESLAQAIRNSI